MTPDAERTLLTGGLGGVDEADTLPTRIETGVDAPQRPRRSPGKHRRRKPFLRELPSLLLGGLLLVVLVKAFMIQAFYIPSGSMELTLKCDDRVLVNRLAYTLGDPARGDVIVFRNWDDVGEDVPSPSVVEHIGNSLREGMPWVGSGRSSEDLIKRVIALPGETVEVRTVGEGAGAKSVAVVNDTPLDEPYVFVNGRDPLSPFGPVVVPEGKYFVMGDHRNNSLDSRRQAEGLFVDRDAMIGKAFVRVWPPPRFGSLSGPAGDADALRPNC